MVKYRLLAAGAVLAVVAMACSSSASPSAAPASQAPASQAPATQAPASAAPASEAPASVAPSESAAPAVKDGGTLVVGLPGDMVLADPTLVSDSNSSYVEQQVVEGLVGLVAGHHERAHPGARRPSLPTVSADGLTYTFTLRQGVKFHDGTRLQRRRRRLQLRAPEERARRSSQNAYNYYFGAVFGFGPTVEPEVRHGDRPVNTVVMTLEEARRATSCSRQNLPQFGIQSPTALKAGDADNPDPTKSPYAQGQGGTGKSMVGTGPVHVQGMGPQRPRHDRQEPRLLGRRRTWRTSTRSRSSRTRTRPPSSTRSRPVTSTSPRRSRRTTSRRSQRDPNFQVIDRGASCNEFHLLR